MEKWFSFFGTLPHWVLAAGLVLLVGLLGAWGLHRAYSRRAEPGAAAADPVPEPAVPSLALVSELLAALDDKAARPGAADQLAQLGGAGIPFLREALLQETDARRLRYLAQVAARLDPALARQLLVAVVQADNLPGRAAALRALASLSSQALVPADAPLFHQLVEEEMQLAQHLLHGLAAAPPAWRAALAYELGQGRQRLLGLLALVYAPEPVRAAERRLALAPASRQAEALAALGQLLPQPLYQGLEALLDATPLPDQVQTFDSLLGPLATAEPVELLVLRRGEMAFSAWTIGLALARWHPQPATVAYLYPHLQAASPLVRESAHAVLRQLPTQRPAAYDSFLTRHPAIDFEPMTTPEKPACRSMQERVHLLKGAALFAETPENVLATIVPIMREVAFAADQEIFAKNSLGTSLFIVCSGEVGVRDGTRQLASFGPGDFFGELALLDAAPRSATAVAHGPVVVFRLDQDDFYEVLAERPEVLRTIMRVLCQRLRHQNEQF